MEEIICWSFSNFSCCRNFANANLLPWQNFAGAHFRWGEISAKRTLLWMCNFAEMAAKFRLVQRKFAGALTKLRGELSSSTTWRTKFGEFLLDFFRAVLYALYLDTSTSDLCYYPFLTYLDVSVFFCRWNFVKANLAFPRNEPPCYTSTRRLPFSLATTCSAN